MLLLIRINLILGVGPDDKVARPGPLASRLLSSSNGVGYSHQ